MWPPRRNDWRHCRGIGVVGARVCFSQMILYCLVLLTVGNCGQLEGIASDGADGVIIFALMEQTELLRLYYTSRT